MITEGRYSIHMSVSVDGALRNKAFTGYTDDKGNQLTKKQAEAHLRILQMKGVKLLPLGECDNFDPDRGCLGHPIADAAHG